MISEWSVKRMYEIANINPRESLKKGTTAKKVPMDQLIPFCRDIPTYQEAIYEGGSKFRNGDTIMARITPCLENGKIAKVNILNENEIGFGSTEYIVFRAKDNVNEDYLYYLVCSSIVRDPAIQSMVGSSGRQRVQIDVLQNLEILVPSKEEQNKIGSILKAIDDKIDINTNINRNLSEQAQAYFDELFIQNASAEWKEGTLSDVGSIVAGGTPFKSNQEYYTDNGIAWITPKDLSVDKSVFISHGENDITELGLQKSSATMMPAGTVLFSSRAPIGYIAIAANDICTNQGFKSVVPNGNVGTSYVYYLLKQLLPTIENMASGSTFKEISGSAMKIVPTVIPDDETLKRFSDFCDPIMKQIWKNEQESKRLVELRDSLLPKLMSGDLDVSDLDI